MNVNRWRRKFKYILILCIALFVTACGGKGEIDLEESTFSQVEEMQAVSIQNSNVRVSGFPFSEVGIYEFTRIDNTLSGYPEGIKKRANKTAGGRIIFKTNSANIDIEILLGKGETYPWFSLSGSVGVDVYKGIGKEKDWVKTYYPDSIDDKTISVKLENEEDIQQFTLNMPLYSEVEDIQIMIDENAELYPVNSYTIEKPIVFYGSSITQGCSATRPGTSYPDIVTRYFDANLVNLGFSSSAKGEEVMAEMIATIDMSALVMEYDHNVETVEELEMTHEKFYRVIRAKHPDIPIVFLSRLTGGLSCSEEEAEQRRSVIRDTYESAIAKGENVYFIDGNELLPSETKDDYFVDGVHPNDRGMAIMAEAVIECLEKEMN